MAEYIERAAAIEAFENGDLDVMEVFDVVGRAVGFSLPNVRVTLQSVPAADVAPVVHGQWDDSGRYAFPSGDVAVRCTNCGCALTEREYHRNNWNYCPVCGAKMK